MEKLPKRTAVFVGGGFTASLAARGLVAQGTDVLFLERGGSYEDSAATRIPSQRDELRWATHGGLFQDLAAETYTLRHSSAETAAPLRYFESFLPGTGMGGAANHWNGNSWRWQDYDPQLRTRIAGRYGAAVIPADMELQDWGVTYTELEPYHDAYEKLFAIGGTAGNLRGAIQPDGNPFEAPRQNPYPLPAMEILEAGSILTAAAAKLGMHPFPMPSANASRAYTNPDGMKLGQCQYCGHCERFMCEANAKASPHALTLPVLRRKPNFEARTFAQVTRLVYDARAKRVTAVQYTDLRTGRQFEQPADVVVLASYVFTNTKLLLTAGIGRPYDPQTRRGVVGKNYCYQTLSGVPVFFRDRWINPFMAAGSSQTVVDDFNNDNFDHAGLGFLGGAYIFSGVTNGRPIGSRLVPPGTPRWGTAWKKANADWYAHSFNISTHGSCYPHRDNYLSLDPTYKDRFGQPLVRITFDWRDNELKMSEYVTKKAEEIARATGATIVGQGVPRHGHYDARVYQSTHNTGGTIMGADPAKSVVSPRLQHWDCQNLFVTGASVYPHNSGYNPTGPIGALSLRLSDDLVAYARRPAHLA